MSSGTEAAQVKNEERLKFAVIVPAFKKVHGLLRFLEEALPSFDENMLKRKALAAGVPLECPHHGLNLVARALSYRRGRGFNISHPELEFYIDLPRSNVAVPGIVQDISLPECRTCRRIMEWTAGFFHDQVVKTLKEAEVPHVSRRSIFEKGGWLKI